MKELDRVISARERDLGEGFVVRRVLPYATRRTVGPFIFFDHMGPVAFAPGKGIDVRPHPHINLATVTYLFEGVIEHRDSLGNDQRIEPGAINWMTAGHGIVHSERSPSDARAAGPRLHGIQCWVALPEDSEEVPCSFVHHPSSTLPEFTFAGCRLKLLLGRAMGNKSPVQVHSDLFYLAGEMPAGARFVFPSENREAAVYVVEGALRVDGQEIAAGSMAVGNDTSDLELEAVADAKIMLLGGSAIGKRYLFWNFVSSSEERLEEAKREWAKGPGNSSRFQKIPGDDREFIPLPPNT